MDVNGGQLTQTNGNPVFPGTTFTGPLLAGNIVHSDGSGALANVGETNVGTANVGYCVMGQTATITQATNGTSAGVFTTPIVIPAQSQILRMTLMVTADWTTTTTMGFGNTVSATAYTGATAVSGAALGQVSASPGTNATAIGNWDNVGTSDVQIVVTSGSTGTGTGTLTVEYLQGINNAS